MANLQIISLLIKKKGLLIKDVCQKVGISDTSLRQIIERNSTKTDIIEKIAEVLNVPVGIFFGEYDIETLQSVENDNDLHREIEHLKEILAEKERTIQILMKQK